MIPKTDVATFAQAWVARHVRGTPGLNVVLEVDRLAAHLTGDARAEGISGRDLHGALGNIDDYLTGHYHQACLRQMRDDPAPELSE
ncbi:MAG TPA: hypothetical protein VIG39_07260 [Rhizomicrobium sp.]|jgi:hypothetical protein